MSVVLRSGIGLDAKDEQALRCRHLRWTPGKYAYISAPFNPWGSVAAVVWALRGRQGRLDEVRLRQV